MAPALCAHTPSVVLKPLAPGCRVTAHPETAGVNHTRRMVSLATPDVPGVYVPFAHHDCPENELISIHNRICGEVPRPTPAGMAALRQGMDLLIRHLPKTVQEPLGEFALKYTGRKRATYLNALDHVLENGLDRKDARVKMFVKCEKMSPAKRNPDPRAIQFRDPKYCVVLASYLKPIEEHLYRLKIKHPLISNTRLVGKGLNQVERAYLLKRKMEAFVQPVVVSIDASRFDQHVDVAQLREEHRVYTHCNPDPYFAQLLSWQCINHCQSRIGFRYVTRGKRMSGDMNTALGNCVIMIGMVLGFMIPRGKRFDLFDDGDDCLLIVESTDLPSLLHDLPASFLEYGHEMKIENIAYDLEAVNWCQSKPVRTKHGLKFVRDYTKVLSTCLVGTRWLNVPERIRLSYLSGLAECELVLNCGVPILQEYALALRRNSRGAEVRHDIASGEWHRYLRESRLYRKVEAGQMDLEITDEARLSFSKAFGVPIDAQLDIERTLSQWNFRVIGDHEEPVNWDPLDWSCKRQLHEFQ